MSKKGIFGWGLMLMFGIVTFFYLGEYLFGVANGLRYTGIGGLPFVLIVEAGQIPEFFQAMAIGVPMIFLGRWLVKRDKREREAR